MAWKNGSRKKTGRFYLSLPENNNTNITKGCLMKVRKDPSCLNPAGPSLPKRRKRAPVKEKGNIGAGRLFQKYITGFHQGRAREASAIRAGCQRRGG